jgi:L-ascorbate metabolism protein UlaG (beta-lactamase superfamily)
MLRLLKYTGGVLIVLTLIIVIFMQQPSFGRLPKGKRLARIEASSNYKDGKFRNLEPTQTIAEGVSYVSMMVDFFGKGVDRQPVTNIPSVKTDLRTFKSDEPAIIWFGHSSFLIFIEGRKILVDPVFSMRPSPVQFAGSKSYPGTRSYSPADFPELDLVIITHDHYDHLDYKSVLALKNQTDQFYAPLGVGEHLSRWGVDESVITEFDWWETEEVFPGIHLTSTPARHFSGRGFSRDRTLWSSYVLKTKSHSIFIGGDSGYDKSFKEIGEKFGPFDIALLECGQYDVKWPLIHMMPEQTVQASLDLKASVLMPVHWGKFTLGLHPWKEPIQRALHQAEKLQVTVTTPMIGEPVVIGKALPSLRWWEK